MSGRLKFRRQSSVAARSFAVAALLANFRPDPASKDLIQFLVFHSHLGSQLVDPSDFRSLCTFVEFAHSRLLISSSRSPTRWHMPTSDINDEVLARSGRWSSFFVPHEEKFDSRSH
ncbi:hypothetical protein ARMGADRAFT_1035103 [Armillaria gallica]|uniref:Uncharacterized protein n=1 Tax=Armillaria gallica TaxID=47427 RepID=A0A2H3CUZ7_ARMGA|nr:hypothetical protein ARMGADRAFT_1035103 [Armillaria gallica]